MDIYWEALPLISGFIIEYFLYTKYKFRAGGVVVIPLLAVYTIKFPALIPTLLFISFVTFVALELLYHRLVIYGRRLMYLALTIGIIFTVILTPLFDSNLGWYTLIIPGLIAYNVHRENNSPAHLAKSLLINTATYLLLIVIGIISLYIF